MLARPPQDDDGHQFALPVTGVAEASALTCAAFHEVNCDGLQLEAAQGQPVKLVNKEYILPGEGSLVRTARAHARTDARTHTRRVCVWLSSSNPGLFEGPIPKRPEWWSIHFGSTRPAPCAQLGSG